MTRYYHSSQILRRLVSVTLQIKYIFHLTLFLLLGLLINSCEEGPTKIGAGMLPGSDYLSIHSTDTISTWSFTTLNEKIRTDDPSYSYIGQIYDPYFGTTYAGFVSQIRMSRIWDGEPFVVDSVKLFLNLLSVKGSGLEMPHYLRISEIGDQIYPDSVYYPNRPLALTGFEIADILLPVLKPDTINTIVIPVPLEFGNYILRDTSMLFYNNNIPDFRSYFKGVYIRIDPGSDPLIATLSLQPTSYASGYYNNYFALYLHDDLNIQKVFYFVFDAINNKNASYNVFSHDYNTADPDKKIQHINDDYRDTLSYLQYLNGLYTTLKFPGLETLKNDPSFDGIAVNRAKITIPVFFDGNLYKPSNAPSQLYLRYKTTGGDKYTVPDYGISSSFFNGKIDTINKVYTFNIPAFVQGYLDDEANVILPELELFQTGISNNLILKANKNTTPAKFDFTYTKF